MDLIYALGQYKSHEKMTEEVPLKYKVVKVFAGHGSWITSSLHYEDRGIMVSSGGDYKIMKWNMKNCKRLDVSSFHSSYVRQVLRWDDDSFLSCSADGRIAKHSVKNFGKSHEVIHTGQGSDGSDQGFYFMTKLDDDRILAVADKSTPQVYVVSVGKKKVVQSCVIDNSYPYFFTTVCRSKAYPGCFYINFKNTLRQPVSISNCVVVLYCVRKNSYVKILSSLKKKSLVDKFALNVFINSRKEDVVCLSGKVHGHDFVTVASEDSYENLSCLKNPVVNHRNVSDSRGHYTSVIVDNKYYVLGGSGGWVTVMSLWGEVPKLITSHKPKGFGSPIYSIHLHSFSRSNHSCIIRAGGSFRTVTLFEINGMNQLSVLDEQDSEDKKERVLFLVEESESFMEQAMLMNMKLKNDEFRGICKAFFML